MAAPFVELRRDDGSQVGPSFVVLQSGVEEGGDALRDRRVRRVGRTGLERRDEGGELVEPGVLRRLVERRAGIDRLDEQRTDLLVDGEQRRDLRGAPPPERGGLADDPAPGRAQERGRWSSRRVSRAQVTRVLD
jgi:hypothetical protein